MYIVLSTTTVNDNNNDHSTCIILQSLQSAYTKVLSRARTQTQESYLLTPGHSNFTMSKSNNLSKPQFFHRIYRHSNTHCVYLLKVVVRL